VAQKLLDINPGFIVKNAKIAIGLGKSAISSKSHIKIVSS